MLEADIISFLADELDLPVYAEVPADAPESFLTVERTSGGFNDHISEATIAIKSYAQTLYDAAVLNEDVKATMLYGMTISSVTSCRLNSDYNFTDTAQKRYRFQAVFNITYYS